MKPLSAIAHTIAFLYLPMLAATPTTVLAQAEPEIVRVEEDWVAYIRSPDTNLTAPQIVNVIAPAPTTEGAFGMVELNHASQPDFHSGGFQVQSWVGETRNEFVFSENLTSLRNEYDRLTYTVAIELTGDLIAFELKDGRSRTWGGFATNGVRAVCPAGDITLAKYDPQFSVDSTSVNVGAHRVEVLFQRETRYYSVNGLERTDTTPRVLHRFQELIQYVSLEEYVQNAQAYNIEITE